MTIEDVIKEAAARGITRLPEPSRLTHVRVWPAQPQWVAEVGAPPHNDSVGDGLYDTKDEAEQAGRKAVQMGRAHLVTLLPADLAATAESWPEPEVTTWN
ncbi:hypothetical protein KN815_13155 [Streptomyces sp. 4503]|uniref:Uncharacterized protein n=1 Tax=Streptomyces niphimycinicus TaxID=2842201 RepID=A0ABS6CDN9_9ACTN|nr:hypothetical protein [Streptomyces niphimycinicus]